MAELPRGTVTLVFTDIEGSTTLLNELGPERYAQTLAEHRTTVRAAFAGNNGIEVDTQGDAFFFAFQSAKAALQAAAEAQRTLSGGPVRIRIGIHSGEPILGEEGYVGIDVHRAARVMAAGHGGQVLMSEATRRLAGDELELIDLGPQRLKDMTAPERLYQLARGEFPPLRTLNQTNLPVTSNPLLGRERELDELTELLTDSARLVTVTGPGGTGKTRMALQVAAELVEEFPDGVFWVPLAGLRNPELVLPSIGHALGAQDDLAAYLRGRKTLALLDNIEHLLEAARPLAELLAAAPDLRLLVTSRSPLHIEAEQEYPLDPLSNEGAVELFCERARQTGAKLGASETVRSICRRLDNLPLAVELAAGRAKLLGSDVLLARLEQRLPLLSGGRRDLPERQRTLRATIEWSYELLGEKAKELFARLSIFAGGFSLEAAEEICEADIDALSDLAELSLLKPVGDGRFLMLETIREYAGERLGEAADSRERHAHWFLALGAEAEERTYTFGQAELFERLENEHDNFRTALDWFAEERRVEELELAAALQDFWIARGHAREGRARLVSALDRAADAPDAVRAKALDGAAWLSTSQQDYESAERFGTESLALARSLGDIRRMVTALSSLGAAQVQQGRYAGARDLYREALSHARETEDEIWVTNLLGQLSDLALYEGAFDEATSFGRECLERAEGQGDVWGMAVSLANLGLASLHGGDDRSAGPYFARSIELAMDLGAEAVVSVALEGIAAMTAADKSDHAAQLVGKAHETLSASGTPLPPFEGRMHARTLAVLEERLGGSNLEQWMRRGAEMKLEAAAALALALARGVVSAADAVAPDASPPRPR
jgi:predicted ATPase/class 3 adenylate cyclase/Tfp pilus assembly protein PilF